TDRYQPSRATTWSRARLAGCDQSPLYFPGLFQSLCLRVFRSIVVSLVVVSPCLVATPAFAQDFLEPSAPDSSAWWAEATAENVSEKKFHLLPDDSEIPRDWVGLTRDTALLLGYQIVGAAILYAVPESVSKWTSHNKDVSFEKWWENAQSPRW